jgi:hypothetical protein
VTTSETGPKLHKAEPGRNTSMQGENGSFVFHGASMPQVADDLSASIQVDRLVLEGTPNGKLINILRTNWRLQSSMK